MAENLTIARPYAQAIFEIAKEHSSFDGWSQTLEALACAASDETFLKVLQNANSADAVKDVETLLGDLLDEQGKNFVALLGENGRFEVLPEIYQEFVRLRDDYLKVKAVELISARPLDEADEQALVEKLERKYNAKISLTKKLDPSIIGGVIIKVGDEIIDASVKTSLHSLSSTLK